MPERAGGRLRAVAWALCGCACLLLAVAALAVAHAEFELRMANERIAEWWRTREPVLIDQAARQLSRAGYALRRAELYALRGEVALIRALDADAPGPWMARAEANYTRSIQARPAWPEGWAHRAVIRARRADTAGMRDDLRQALRLGPNTGMILAILAPHAGVVTARLTPEDRAQLAALGGRLARFNFNTAAGLIRRLGLLREWCTHPVVAERAPRDCPAATSAVPTTGT